MDTPRGPVPENRPLILASGSPRRAELLRAAGYRFRTVVPDESAECGMCSRETPPELVARLAFQKARDVVPRVSAATVLAADTIAECRGTVLGKPQNRRHAEEMLQLLSGRDHAVYTGVCLWRVPENRLVVDVTRTGLVMRPLDDEQRQQYLATDKWQGKAGAFGYQDDNDWLKIQEGSESNVVGLPLERLSELLERFDQLSMDVEGPMR